MIRYRKFILDLLVHGKGICKYGTRKWYNPFRYIIGKIYCKHITLHEVFK